MSNPPINTSTSINVEETPNGIYFTNPQSTNTLLVSPSGFSVNGTNSINANNLFLQTQALVNPITPSVLAVSNQAVVGDAKTAPQNTISLATSAFGGGSQIYMTSDGGTTTNAYYKPTQITLNKGANTITIDASANTIDCGTGSFIANNYRTINETANSTHYFNFSNAPTTGVGNIQKCAGLSCNPSTNTITATTFVGALNGNATSATTATSLNATARTGTNTQYYPLVQNTASNTTYYDNTTKWAMYVLPALTIGGTNTGWFDLGSGGTFTIPNAGVWSITAQLSIGYNSSGWIKQIISSSSSNSNEILSQSGVSRALWCSYASPTNELQWVGNWLLNVGTDLLYPKAIYPITYINNVNNFRLWNDINGVPVMSAVRIAEPLGTGLYVVA